MVSIVTKAIYTKRIMTKKSISVIVTESEENGKRFAFDDEQSSRVVVFTLFCHYLSIEHSLGMTDLFKGMCM